jgi:hypothetical protein
MFKFAGFEFPEFGDYKTTLYLDDREYVRTFTARKGAA